MVVVLLLLPLYAWTSPPGVALEDDGLFAMSTHFLGIPQPPGYPLHTLLGKLFTMLPLGSVAYRVHLLSSVFAAGTCAVLWSILRLLGCCRVAAYAGALVLGVSGTFWSQAIIGEVYSLNTFLFFGLLLTTLAFVHQHRIGILYLAAGCLGLGLANHWPMFVLSLPAVGLALYPARHLLWQQTRGRLTVLLAVVLATGGLPYLWMIVRTHSTTPINFYGSLNSLTEVIHFISRRGFEEVDTSQSSTVLDKLQFLALMGKQLAAETTWLGLALALVGATFAWRRLGPATTLGIGWAGVATSFLLVLLLGFDFDPLMRTVIRVYPLIPVGVLAIGLGLALDAPPFSAHRTRRLARMVLVGGLVGATFWTHVGTNNRHSYTWATDYAHAVLDQLPEDAVLFVRGDMDSFPLGYLHWVEGVRPDVTLYNDQGLLFDNRLFGRSEALREDKVGAFIRGSDREVFQIEPIEHGVATTNGALYVRARRDLPADRLTFELTDSTRAFLQKMEATQLTDAWSLYHRNLLRRRFVEVLDYFRIYEPTVFGTAGLAALAEQLEQSPYARLGHLAPYNLEAQPPQDVLDLIDGIAKDLGQDVTKADRASLSHVRGLQLFRQKRVREAVASLGESVAIFPNRKNPAIMRLLEYYSQTHKRKDFFALGNRYFLGQTVSETTRKKLLQLGVPFTQGAHPPPPTPVPPTEPAPPTPPAPPPAEPAPTARPK